MKAVLVICEGRSDIAFVRRSLTVIESCKGFKGRISDLPKPFSPIPTISKDGSTSKGGFVSEKGLIVEHMGKCFEKKQTDDPKLSGATSLPPPNFDAVILNKDEDIIYLFVNAGGRDQHNAVIELLKNIDVAVNFIRDEPAALLNEISVTSESGYPNLDNSISSRKIAKYAVAFLFDANNRGKDKVVEDFEINYCGHFGFTSVVRDRSWVRSKRCPVGLYVCCNDDGRGALENYIIPMTELAWKERHNGASNFIKIHRCADDKVSKSDTNMFKAIIAIVGQFNFPGDSLFSLINDENKGIPDEQFKTSEACINLVKFIQDVPWED